MQYRTFGNTDLDISTLGFGCMRFPVIDGDQSKIDEDEAKKMVRYAIDNGVNYIDTAYPYHQGESERFVANALKDGYREKVYLATKHPVWLVESYEDFDKYLNEQLDRLETDYIDFYLLHALSKDRWKKIKDLGALDFLNKALEDGRIKHAGFSFHDDIDTFKEIVDAYDWTFTQIQLNYMDEDYQAGLEGLNYASDKGLAIIIMEPLKGGKLAQEPKGDVKKLFEQHDVENAAADLALRWVWNDPKVHLVLSGMSTLEQVEQNIETVETALPNSLAENQLNLVNDLKTFYKTKTKVDCTACGYCVPCPSNVIIPNIFGLYNELAIYDAKDAHNHYSNIMKNEKDASVCVECGQCEAACPQNLPIIEHLKEAHGILNK